MLLHAGLGSGDLAHIHAQGLCALHQVFAHMPLQRGVRDSTHTQPVLDPTTRARWQFSSSATTL